MPDRATSAAGGSSGRASRDSRAVPKSKRQRKEQKEEIPVEQLCDVDERGMYVPAGFPNELLLPRYTDNLIRESPEDHVISARIEAETKKKLSYSSLDGFLQACRLVETETLNDVAVSGACQFSSLADQLWGSPVTDTFRPELHLRRLALEVVRIWHDNFADFFLVADSTTRLQQSQGGRTVDVDDFLVKMSYCSCDGDHITLQAISDVTKCRVNVIKWTGSWTGSSDGSGSVYVAARLSPRAYIAQPGWYQGYGPGARGGSAPPQLEVPQRTLWLSLHGEVHFRSLHAQSISSIELSSADSTREACKIDELTLKPVCNLCHLEVLPGSSEICWPFECSTRRAARRRHCFHFGCLLQRASECAECPSCKQRFTAICRHGQDNHVISAGADGEDAC